MAGTLYSSPHIYGAPTRSAATVVPKTPATTTSTPSLYDQAAAMAKQALQAQIDPLNQEITSNNTNAAAQQQAALANAMAVSNLLKTIGPQVLGAFNQAADTQGILGKGFSGAVQDTLNNNASNVNDLLSKIGAPSGQSISPDKAQNVADVLYGTGGYIPGNTFAKQGAGFAAAADMLPGTALLQGQQNSANIATQNIAANAKIQQNIAELAGKLPGDIQTNYMNLQKLALEDKKFAAQLANDKFNQAYKTASLKLQQAKYQTSVDEFNVNTGIKRQSLALQAQRLAQSQYNADRNYQISLANLGISQKRLQQTIVANAFKEAHGGYGPVALRKAQEKALVIGEYAATTLNKKGEPVPFATALKEGLAKGLPVQTLINSLSRSYEQHGFGKDIMSNEQLQQLLGPLSPESIRNSAAAMANALGTVTDPTAAITKGTVIPQEKLPELAAAALQIAAPEFATPDNVRALVGRIMQESGGNPRAVNLWDSNAKAGHPSKGILQTIDSTFNAHALPGYTDIWNPLDNAVAAIRYMIARYGRIVGPSNSGY